MMTAWFMLPVYYALIACAIIQTENWLARRDRRNRREGRRQTLQWLEQNKRNPW